MNRRDFLKTGAAAAIGTAVACKSNTKGQVSQTAGSDDKMTYRDFLGDHVSLLGYGCMRWPMIKDSSGNEVIDQQKVNEMVDYAMAQGINYYDTSPVYLQGQSEAAVGEALKKYPRDSYYLATKLSNFSNNDATASKQMYKRSMEQLNTDYFDYYLLHAIGRGGVEAFNARYVDNGLMDFLLAEREAGRIRHLGFSFHGAQADFDALFALHDKYHWDFVQIEMNYIDWRHADGVRNTNAEYLYNAIAEKGIPMIVMEPLLGGRLASVPSNIATRFKERRPDSSNAEWAFRFAGTPPYILSVLSGMTYLDHVQENVKTFSGFEPMSEEELSFMEEMAVMYKEYPLVNCTNCKYCMPCPWGIDIPGIFAHYNKAINDGTFATGREQKDYQKLRRAYLISYDKAIPTVRQASHCIGCGHCLPECPQSIQIPTELRRIDAYIEKLKQDTL